MRNWNDQWSLGFVNHTMNARNRKSRMWKLGEPCMKNAVCCLLVNRGQRHDTVEGKILSEMAKFWVTVKKLKNWIHDLLYDGTFTPRISIRSCTHSSKHNSGAETQLPKHVKTFQKSTRTPKLITAATDSRPPPSILTIANFPKTWLSMQSCSWSEAAAGHLIIAIIDTWDWEIAHLPTTPSQDSQGIKNTQV